MASHLFINLGSSSIKVTCFNRAGEKIFARLQELKEIKSQEEIRELLKEYYKNEKFLSVTFRIVHGGDELFETCVLDKENLNIFKEVVNLAPLHNLKVLKWIEVSKDLFDCPIIGVFDTTFFQKLPDVSSKYAIPLALSKKFKIKKYGFHGLAHEFMLSEYSRIENQSNQENIITLQLGSGSSIAAIKNLKPIDTSMGFSPMDGLVMSTRCGEIDPGVIFYLNKVSDSSVDEIESVLNNQSGLLGLTDKSGDMKSILEGKDENSILAVDLYIYRILKYIGAFSMVLKGVDAIIFGGGVGENSPYIRKRVIDGLGWLGCNLDEKNNQNMNDKINTISSIESKIKVFVCRVDETEVMYQETIKILSKENDK